MNERPWIREATSRDIDRLVDLWAEHVDFHARLDPRFERGRGSEAGFAEYLREGIGTDLLQRAMAWFGEKGAPTVEGRVLMANPLAMGFWAKAGFEPYMQIIRSRPSGE